MRIDNNLKKIFFSGQEIKGIYVNGNLQWQPRDIVYKAVSCGSASEISNGDSFILANDYSPASKYGGASTFDSSTGKFSGKDFTRTVSTGGVGYEITSIDGFAKFKYVRYSSTSSYGYLYVTDPSTNVEKKLIYNKNNSVQLQLQDKSYSGDGSDLWKIETIQGDASLPDDTRLCIKLYNQSIYIHAVMNIKTGGWTFGTSTSAPTMSSLNSTHTCLYKLVEV